MRSAILSIILATLSLQGFAQTGPKSFELNNPLPSSNPGAVVTSMPTGLPSKAGSSVNGSEAQAPAPLVSTGGLPLVPASLPSSVVGQPVISALPPSSAMPASSSTSAPLKPAMPVKTYGTLAQAAADGVNPLAPHVEKTLVAPIPAGLSPTEKLIQFSKENIKIIALGLLLVLLLGVGSTLIIRRKSS